MIRSIRCSRQCRRVSVVALVLAASSIPVPLVAQERGLDTDRRAAIVRAISKDLDAVYVFPDVAKEMIALLDRRLASGAYDDAPDVETFAARLTEDLQSISHDRHLRVLPMGEEPGAGGGHDADPEERRRQRREQSRRVNYGFQKLEILGGNVGYLDLRQFDDAELGGRTAVAAMNFLADADALIVDLRQNGGGSPSMIQLISSYLFEEPVHLNSFYIRREDSMAQFWTQAHVAGPRMADTPVYVLTSRRTFSAAEEFTYNLKNLERATIVGETTGGGAHPVDMAFYPELGVLMSLPFGRAVNPVTGTNWEGTGVEPHVAVDAREALQVAHAMALRELAEGAQGEARRQIEWALAGLEAEEIALPVGELQAYVGTYGPREIRLVEGRLVYQREGGPELALLPTGEDRFHLRGLDDFRIRFERDERGKVATLIGLYSDGREEPSLRSDG